MNIQSSAFPIQDERHGYSKVMVFMLFMYALVLWSPLTAAMGIRRTAFSFLIVLTVLILSLQKGRPFQQWFVLLSISALLSASIVATYWMEPRFLLQPIGFFTGILLLSQSTWKELERFIDLSSWFLAALLIGAVIGYALAAAGMPPLFEFPRPSSAMSKETIYFFGTTLTNVYWDDNTIRPAGIYDEPGALSFVTCMVAYLRHTLNRSNGMTWALLALGLITLSLAHVIFVTLFFLSERLSARKMGTIAAIVGTFIVIATMSEFGRTLERRLLWRIALTESGTLAGDNRSLMMMNAAKGILSAGHVPIVGIGPDLTFETEKFYAENAPMGENPLHPLVARGILVSWPYYAFLAAAVLLALLGRKNLAFFAVGSLFVQRPYLFTFGYSLLGVLALWLQLTVRSVPGALKAGHEDGQDGTTGAGSAGVARLRLETGI